MRARLRRSESIEKAAVSDSWARDFHSQSFGKTPDYAFIRAVLGFHFWRHSLVIRRRRRWCPSVPSTRESSFGSCRRRRVPPAPDPPAEVAATQAHDQAFFSNAKAE